MRTAVVSPTAIDGVGNVHVVTPAVTALVAASIHHEVIAYDHGDDRRDFGREAAEELGVPAEQVFKTLVVRCDDDSLAVAVVPVSCSLSLKKMALALRVKRCEMCDPARAERSSGYVVGGISPIGHRTGLPTVIDESADLFETVYVSGGRRGIDLALAPGDLAAVTRALIADITA